MTTFDEKLIRIKSLNIAVEEIAKMTTISKAIKGDIIASLANQIAEAVEELADSFY